MLLEKLFIWCPILAFIVFIVGFCLWLLIMHNKTMEKLEGIVVNFLMIFLPICIVAFPHFVICIQSEVGRTTVVEELTRNDIYSVNVELGMKGEGESGGNIIYQKGKFLIETFDEYNYYYMTENGLKRGAVPVGEAYIQESDEEKPAIIEYCKYDEVISVYDVIGERKKSREKETKYYVFIVPKGSVVRSFELN